MAIAAAILSFALAFGIIYSKISILVIAVSCTQIRWQNECVRVTLGTYQWRWWRSISQRYVHTHFFSNNLKKHHWLMMKVVFAEEMILGPAMFAGKAALLLLYYRIFSPSASFCWKIFVTTAIAFVSKQWFRSAPFFAFLLIGAMEQIQIAANLFITYSSMGPSMSWLIWSHSFSRSPWSSSYSYLYEENRGFLRFLRPARCK